MAKGDLLYFNDVVDDIGNKLHNFETDTFKFALVTNATVPSVTTANPHWGGTGTTDFEVNEVSGTGYTAGGIDIAGTYSTTGAVATFDGVTNPAWTQNAAGPSDVRWGIIYNDTHVNKPGLAFIAMGGAADISLIDGDISFTFHANGISTLTRT